MLEFKNNYIYTVDTINQQITILTGLPMKWKDPVTEISYSNLRLFSETELNNINWYKVMEDHPIESMTQYQIEEIDTYSFDLVNNYFIVIFTQTYRSLDEVRNLKTTEIINLKTEFIENKLDNVDDIEKWVYSYKAISKLIEHLSPLVPAINNDTYLQTIFNKMSNLSDQISVYNDNIDIVSNETDIQNIINL